jgi:hypothetical protein
MYCTRCGKALTADGAFCGKCGSPVNGEREQAAVGVVVHDVVRSQIAVGNGNVQVQVTVEGTSRIGERDGGIELRAREIPVLAATSRADLIGRDVLVEQTCDALSGDRSVQLFGAPGVGRSAVAEAVRQRLAETGMRGIELRPDNEPHTLESLYRRLLDVFFGVVWYQPDEAVLRLEVTRFELRALIIIIDCDITADDLGRLLGTFAGCTFLLTSHRRTLAYDAGTALEVDPLSAVQARELITRALGGAPVGLQNVQWEQAYRLAGGQVQRLVEHIAFIKRAASRPEQTDLLNVPISEQIALLIAGLSEAARRVVVALATYQLSLAPAVFTAVTGLSAAADATDELVTAGVVSADGTTFRIVPDAAAAIVDSGERSDPAVAADGLLRMLGGRGSPDPHLVLAVARALRQQGDEAGTVSLARVGAPAAIAAGPIGVWVSLVALGVQTATSSKRKQDLEFFLNEEHTSAVLRGDAVAAAAALAALAELLSEQPPAAVGAPHQAVATGTHQMTAIDIREPSPAGQQGGTARAARAGRVLRQAKHGPLAGHPGVVIAAVAVGVAAVAGTVTATTIGSGQSAPSIVGAWTGSEGGTFTFRPSGPGTYTVSLTSKDAPKCAEPDDGTVTGSKGHYNGSIDLYQQSGTAAGQCAPKVGTARITIAIAANGSSASVDLIGTCKDCDQQTWTRQ